MNLDEHLKTLIRSADSRRAEDEETVTFAALVEAAIRLRDPGLDFERVVTAYLAADGDVDVITSAVYWLRQERFDGTKQMTLYELWEERHWDTPHVIEIDGKQYNGATLATTELPQFTIHEVAPNQAGPGEPLVTAEVSTFPRDTTATVKWWSSKGNSRH